MLARISARFGFRYWGLGVVLGMETVRGAGVMSLMVILTSTSFKSASEDVGDEAAEGEKEGAEAVDWVLSFRGIMVDRQKWW